MNALNFIKLLKEVNWDGSKLEKGLTVGGWLDLRGTAITSLPDNLTVGGWLDLQGTAITSLPDNLTVGGWLYLRGTAITSLPDNLTVGGSLYLRGTAITSLPDNLTVGGWLDLQGTAIKDTSMVKKLKHGYKTDKWIFVDGILTHIQKVKKINDITLYIAPYNTVVATKDHETFAQGGDIRSAIRDLKFKLAKRNIDDYRELSLDTELKFNDAVVMYRVITGSCAYGTQRFIDEHPELKDKKTITVQEIIDMTNDEYGSKEFRAFFEEELK